MEHENRTKRVVVASLFAALVCVATMIIKIPSPLKGYMNLGDGILLLAGWMLLPTYGFLAAGIGSALADLFSGYLTYAPATFLIKGLMALIACHGFSLIHRKLAKKPARVASGILAEVLMVMGYYLFEGVLYGFGPALVNIPANVIQGMAGLILGCVLIHIFEKNKITF